jgi:hypothetical protein
MKFGVREICDVVLRTKSATTIGNLALGADEPVLYFDSAKTSTIEGTATTVYATGGRGNSKLIAWEGERAVTFTMEDALLSTMGFAILSGAGIVEASTENKIKVHSTAKLNATVGASGAIEVDLTQALGTDTLALVPAYAFVLDENGDIDTRLGKVVPLAADQTDKKLSFTSSLTAGKEVTILVDFYVEKSSGVKELTVEPGKFAGYYYLEADTLFRRQSDGADLPASFVIPKVKIQSAFKFTMASSGDPSTFEFKMDAFPDFTKFDSTKKVLFALQVVED